MNSAGTDIETFSMRTFICQNGPGSRGDNEPTFYLPRVTIQKATFQKYETVPAVTEISAHFHLSR